MLKKSCLPLALLMAVSSTAAFAQANANPDLGHYYDVANVPADDPFGGVDVSTAGDTVESVRTYLNTITATQLIDIIQRCTVINPLNIMWGNAMAAEGGEAAQAAADPNANPGANPPAEPAPANVNAAANPAPAAEGGEAAQPAYNAPDVSFCQNVQLVLFGDRIVMDGAGYGGAAPGQ